MTFMISAPFARPGAGLRRSVQQPAATDRLRCQAEALGIPPERTICIGDVVAYCAEPEETVRHSVGER